MERIPEGFEGAREFEGNAKVNTKTGTISEAKQVYAARLAAVTDKVKQASSAYELGETTRELAAITIGIDKLVRALLDGARGEQQ